MEVLLAFAALVGAAGLSVLYYAIYRGGRYAWERQTTEERRRNVRVLLPSLIALVSGGVLLAILGVDPRSRDFWRVWLYVVGGAIALGFIGSTFVALWQWLRRE
jgi:apolipoprotein N-acyltransferase